MKKINLLLILSLVLAMLSLVPMIYAQCVESPNDTFNCNATDTDGVTTALNGSIDVVNLNGNAVNNSTSGIYGISGIKVTVNGSGSVTGSAFGIAVSNRVTTNNVDIIGLIHDGIRTQSATINGGSVTGAEYGIFAHGQVTVTNAIITGNNFEGIYDIGDVTVTGGSITGDDGGIFATGNVVVTNAAVTGNTQSGLNVYGTVDVMGGSVSGYVIGISSTGLVTVTDATITGTTLYGIAGFTSVSATNSTITGHVSGILAVNGSIDVVGGSVTGTIYGLYARVEPLPIDHAVSVDSATITGGTAAILLADGNDKLTLTNTTSIPVINGVMDGGDGFDTFVGIKAGSSGGTYIEKNFTCADVAALCNGDLITASRQGITYTFDNFEAVTIIRWKPF